MSKTEINSESSSSEHNGAICCLCFRIDDFTKTEIAISENFESIYKSCSQHLNKENLTNDFFKWTYPSPLPFCISCSLSVRKIHHLNIKLEHLQNRIEFFVKSFTKRFLRARRNRTNSSLDGCDLERDKNCKIGSPNDVRSGTPISNSVDFPSEVDEVVIKQEGEESQQEAFSETETTANTDFNSLSEDEDDCNFEDDPLEAPCSPTSETDSETSKKGNSSRTKYHARRKRVIKKELNLKENKPDKPRRRAAIKAEKSFINWSKDLNDEDNTNKDSRKLNRSKSRSVKEVESFEKQKAAVGLKTKRIKKESQTKQDKEGRLKRAIDEKEVLTNELDDERKYKCTKCNKTYKSRQHLRDHTLTHDQNKRFHCVPCGVSYAYRRNLRQHNILKHNEKIRKYSSKSSGSSDTRSSTLSRKRADKIFVCTLCEKTYKTLQNLREHERTHDKDQRFKCTLCDASYAYIRNLRLHLLKHNEDKVGTFVLTKSKNTIKIEKEGGGTETVKEKKRTFVCKICGKICTTPGQLFYHRQTHKAPEAELKCKLCNKTFKNILNMKKHERVIHQEQNTYLCPVCGKEFRSSTGLKDHYDRHNRDETAEREKFGCTVCSKKFSTKHSLNRHESRHNSEKKFECDICKKKFFTQFEVKNHLVYHKGERAFTCEECGKSFFTKAKLDAHNRIHTGMLFPCEYCHKGFQTTTHLKQHYRSHSRVNEQPKFSAAAVETKVPEVLPQPTFSFSCQHCNQFFSSESAIHAHILIAHTQQAFIADFTTFTT